MDLKNLKVFNMPKAKTRLCALALAGTLMVTSLTGCSGGSKTNDKGESISGNSNILLTSGDITYSMEINGYTRWSSGWIEITLADGSKVSTNEMNVIAFNSNSKMMEQVTQEKGQSLTLVP